MLLLMMMMMMWMMVLMIVTMMMMVVTVMVMMMRVMMVLIAMMVSIVTFLMPKQHEATGCYRVERCRFNSSHVSRGGSPSPAHSSPMQALIQCCEVFRIISRILQ